MLFPWGWALLGAIILKQTSTLLSASISPLWVLIITEMDTLILQPQRAAGLQDLHRNESACQGKHLTQLYSWNPTVNTREVDLRLM